MLSVEEALRSVLEQAPTPDVVERATPESLGLVLAETIVSPVDSPANDKSLMDGYAIVSSDVGSDGGSDGAVLRVLEEVTAGAVPTRPVVSGTATRIMTGAPLPDGADAVVMVEHTEMESIQGTPADPPRVRIRATTVKLGQNILRRGQSMRAGDVVLSAGRDIRAIEIGLLAELGRTRVQAYRTPNVAVLATGNELVPPDRQPLPGQIRNSNGWMLEALVRSAGAQPVSLGVARDTRDDLSEHLQRGLAADVLVLSGGVSAGVLDLVPETLASLGVRQVFHKVHLRPGKPIWFGVREPSRSGNADSGRSTAIDSTAIDSTRPCLVFGLPGNPVSSLVCFELFVRPVLARLRGKPGGRSETSGPVMGGEHARLAHSYKHRGDRPTLWPAVLEDAADDSADGSRRVRLLNWQGSADLRTLCDADCLVHFPPGDRAYDVGDEVLARRLATRW